MTSWGIAATIKAPARDVLNFVAHHLELGANHIWIYLDAPNLVAQDILAGHDHVTVTLCDDAYWQHTHGQRPHKHQVRQAANIMQAYERAEALDWLLHIDVDEFLWPQRPISELLAQVPATCLIARVRPSEALCSDGIADADPDLIWFKTWISGRNARRQVVPEIYPTYGHYVKGGFMSHVAGKIFVRTGQKDLKIRIHNAVQNKIQNPEQIALEDVELLHLHATSWEHWMKSFGYRHKKGSYRADLGAALPAAQGGMNLHELFAALSQEPDGLRGFFEEVCLATPELRAKLEARGMLRGYRLGFDAKRKRQFPEFTK